MEQINNLESLLSTGICFKGAILEADAVRDEAMTPAVELNFLDRSIH